MAMFSKSDEKTGRDRSGSLRMVAGENAISIIGAGMQIEGDIVTEPATTISFTPDTLTQLSAGTRHLFHDSFIKVLVRRLHTAHDADRIAVVQDGRIVELGSHDELMEADGEYAALWRAWTS